MTNQDVMRIAAEASVDVRTVKRWLRGESLRTLTKERIEAAAKKLGKRRGAK
jgi:DNA-binding LacI/PurR family transcriptional regulator